jgi:signal transduction histidine kinase
MANSLPGTSFRRFLVLAAIAILLPFLALSAITLFRSRMLYNHAIEAELQAITRLTTEALDDDLSERIAGLTELAPTNIDTRDLADIRRGLNKYLLQHPSTRSVSLLGRDRKPVIQAGRIDGQDIPRLAAALGVDAATGTISSNVAELVRDPAEGDLLIAIAVPIGHSAAQAEGSFLAIEQRGPFLSDVFLNEEDRRRGWDAAVVDQHSVVMLHSNPTFVGRPFPYSQLDPLLKETQPVVRSIQFGRKEYYVAVRRSRVVPWHVVYLVLAATLVAPLQQTWFDLAVLAVLSALPIAGSAMLGRYLGRRIEALAVVARSVSSEATPVVMATTGLWEIDVVQQALQHASKAVQERAAARERIYDMEAVLHRAQRMETLGQVTAGIAHDFGNLVFTIRGNLELLKRALVDDELVRRLVDPPLQLANEAARLISHLSSGIRHKEQRTRQINVNEQLSEIADLLRQVAGRTIQVEIEPGIEVFDCSLDPTLLKSALLNLVINARNAMRDGGAIHIRSANSVLDDQAAAAVGLKSAGQYVALSVADTGVGIPPTLRERLFEPFFTAREGGLGMGIGLSILYGFVKSAGGNVVVRSTVGKGSAFILYFPAVPPSGAPIDRENAGMHTASDRAGTPDSSGC